MLKGLTCHKLAPGAELTVHGDDHFAQFSYHFNTLSFLSRPFFLISFEARRLGFEPESPGGDHCHIFYESASKSKRPSGLAVESVTFDQKVMRSSLATKGINRQRELKGSTHHKLVPGAELIVKRG